MSVYEDALTERCVDMLTAYLRASGPQRVIRLRAYLAEHGAELDPAYKGGLIDNAIWRRTFTALEERGIAEMEQVGDQIWYRPIREAEKVTLPSGVEVTIEGPFAPGEMPENMQRQWDELKRTGIGPNDPDF